MNKNMLPLSLGEYSALHAAGVFAAVAAVELMAFRGKSMEEAAKTAALGGIPMGRMGAAEDAAKAVAFLVSEEAGYITGQVLAVDDGIAM